MLSSLHNIFTLYFLNGKFIKIYFKYLEQL